MAFILGLLGIESLPFISLAGMLHAPYEFAVCPPDAGDDGQHWYHSPGLPTRSCADISSDSRPLEPSSMCRVTGFRSGRILLGNCKYLLILVITDSLHRREQVLREVVGIRL